MAVVVADVAAVVAGMLVAEACAAVRLVFAEVLRAEDTEARPRSVAAEDFVAE